MSERVLVTGASGFVGRQVLAPLLARGFELHTCGRSDPVAGLGSHHRLDFSDSGAARALLERLRPHRILHLAWYVEHRLFWEAPENMLWRDWTLEFGRAAVAAGVQRFVAVGTCAEYDPSVRPGEPRREDDPLAGSTCYGRIKIETFLGLDAIFRAGGVSFAWARLFNLHGEGEAADRLIPQLLASLARNEPFRLAAPHALRDVTDTEVIGAALAALVASDVEGPINVASGRIRSLAEICLELARRQGKEHLVDQSSGGGAGDALTADVSRALHAGLL